MGDEQGGVEASGVTAQPTSRLSSQRRVSAAAAVTATAELEVPRTSDHHQSGLETEASVVGVETALTWGWDSEPVLLPAVEPAEVFLGWALGVSFMTFRVFSISPAPLPKELSALPSFVLLGEGPGSLSWKLIFS